MVVQHPSFKAPEELLIFVTPVADTTLVIAITRASIKARNGIRHCGHVLTPCFLGTCEQTALDVPE
jgi:hypothetical protein